MEIESSESDGDEATMLTTEDEQGAPDFWRGEEESESYENATRFRRLPKDFIISVPSRESILNQNRRRRQARRRLDAIEDSEENSLKRLE